MDLRRIYNNLRRNNGNLSEDELRRRAWVMRDRLMFESLANSASSAAAGAGGGGGRRSESEVEIALKMSFDDISTMNTLMTDYNNVEEWNALFGLPGENGEAYTEIIIDGNNATLKGGYNVILKEIYFSDSGVSVTSIEDTGTIIELGEGVFYGTPIQSAKLKLITYIGAYTFGDCNSLSEVYFPEVTEITGEYAFNDTQLTVVDTSNFPKLVSAPYESTFYNCNFITSVDLPYVTELGDSTFDSCNILTTVNLPLVETIGTNMFRNCSVSSANMPLLTSLPNGTFNHCEFTELTTSMFPLVTTIGNSCFAYNPITSVSLENVVTIGTSIFLNCTELIDVYLPSIGTIPNSCFAYCTSLPAILSEALPNVNTIEPYAFYHCENLLTFELSSVFSNEIPHHVFSYCSVLDFTVIDFTAIEIIGAAAFSYTQITSVDDTYFPVLNTVGAGAFYQCTELSAIYMQYVTHLPDACFAKCTGISQFNDVMFPSVVTMDNSVFVDCENMVDIDHYGITTMGTSVFDNCNSVSNVYMDGLETMGNYCFRGLNITTISLPSLVSTGNGAFMNCTQLSDISLPVCTSLGTNNDDNEVFLNVVSNAVNLTIHNDVWTVNEGLPDGDIVYLQDNNDVTVNVVGAPE